MENELRRPAEELICKYNLEPDLRDIFVEGDLDEYLLNWMISEKNISHLKVYNIETIDIPKNTIPKPWSGNKGRVIALSNLFMSELIDVDNVRCIVDKDFDQMTGCIITSKYLLYSDFANMEMYTFNDLCLKKLFESGLRKKFTADIFSGLSKVLQEVFIIRLVKELKYKNKTWVKLDRCCEYDKDSGEINFNTKSYVSRLTGFLETSEEVDQFLKDTQEQKKHLNVDCRQQIHGHDYISILVWLAKQIGVKANLCNKESISSILWTSLLIDDFLSNSLLQNIITFSSQE